MRIALTGASGFVGSAIAAELSDHEVVRVAAPRIVTRSRLARDLIAEARAFPASELKQALAGCDVVINAAGDPDASSRDCDSLFGANALFPAVLASAAAEAGVSRMVHVSSAVVQNDKAVLDESEEMTSFSPYSASKIAGETVLRESDLKGMEVVRYRPPSVHAPRRGVTRKIARIANSRLASVARPGSQPSPQALLPNVAAAAAYLATCRVRPAPIVMHPWEGVTAQSLMTDLSNGNSVLRVPARPARVIVSAAKVVGRYHLPSAANARRLEIIWFGQEQAQSWLESQEFELPLGRPAWSELVKGAG